MVLVSGARRAWPRSRSCGSSATAPRGSAAAVAVAAIVVGWALAQNPYLLPGELTLEQGAADDAVLGRGPDLDGASAR